MRPLAIGLLLLLAQDKKPPPLKISKVHPRLFGNQEQLKQMAQLRPKYWQGVLKGGDTIRPLKIRSLGFAYQVNGDKKSAEKAIELAREVIKSGITTEHVEFETRMWPVAEAFDLCTPLLNKQDRKDFIDYLNQMFDANRKAGVDSFVGPFHNTHLRRILAFALAGYATYPENPRAEEIINHVKKTELGEILLPAMKIFLADGGGWYEGRGYEALSVFELMQFADIAKRVEGYDLFAELNDYFNHKCLHEMFANYPGLWKDYKARRWAVQGDGHDAYAGFCELNRAARYILWNAYKDKPHGMLLASYNAETPDCTIPGYAVLDFLYKPDGAPMLPLDECPQAHFEEGVGTLFAVSGWTPDATWMRFQCGHHFTWHQHYEQNSFDIFKKGRLATNGGVYDSSPHATNYYIRSVAHNTVLVYLPGEKWTQMRDGKDAESNDGGQAAKWAPRHTCPDVATLKKDLEKYDSGEILAYETRGPWTYVCGEATDAYVAEKMKKFVRHMVFLRPDLFVIFDVVETAKEGLRTTWVMNTVNEPVVKDGVAEAKEGDGRLLLQCLLPEKAEPKIVKDFTVDGKAYPPGEKTADFERAGKFRIEIDSKEKTKHYFLNVISTGDLMPKIKVARDDKAGLIGVDLDGLPLLFKSDGTPGGKLGKEDLPSKIPSK